MHNISLWFITCKMLFKCKIHYSYQICCSLLKTLVLKNVNTMQVHGNCRWYWEVTDGRKNQFAWAQGNVLNIQDPFNQRAVSRNIKSTLRPELVFLVNSSQEGENKWTMLSVGGLVMRPWWMWLWNISAKRFAALSATGSSLLRVPTQSSDTKQTWPLHNFMQLYPGEPSIQEGGLLCTRTHLRNYNGEWIHLLANAYLQLSLAEISKCWT